MIGNVTSPYFRTAANNRTSAKASIAHILMRHEAGSPIAQAASETQATASPNLSDRTGLCGNSPEPNNGATPCNKNQGGSLSHVATTFELIGGSLIREYI